MDITFSPFFSPVSIGLLVLIGLVVVWILERNWAAKICFGLLVVLLGVIALKPSLITRQLEHPDRPIQVIYENNQSSLNSGIKQSAENLSERLRDEISGAGVEVVPLDRRWDRPPVFRDYHRFDRRVKADHPLRIIVGTGRHTTTTTAPSIRAEGQSFRARFQSDTSPANNVPYIRAENPVRTLNTPGKATWTVNVRHADRLDNPVLQIRDGKSIEVRTSVDAVKNQSVEVTSSRRDRGHHYFVAELVDGKGNNFDPGHPRRMGLGLVVAGERQQILLSDRYPSWGSGWWGRKINNFGQWNLDYQFRGWPDQKKAGDVSQYELVIYFGFPASTDHLERFRRVYRSADRLLWVLDRPEQRGSAEAALSTAGFENTASFTVRKGELSPRVNEQANRRFPALSRYRLMMESAPPFRTVIAGLELTGGFQAVMSAGESPLVLIDESAARGVVTTPELHRWAMRWGRVGRPETGSDLVREWVDKMLRLGEIGSARRLEYDWVRAGQPVTLKSGKNVRVPDHAHVETVGQSGNEGVRRLVFSRPGKYTVSGTAEDGTQWEESLLVVEPNQERIPGRSKPVRRLVSDEQVFHSMDKLTQWTLAAWDNRTRRTETTFIGWNHYLVLIVLVGLLSGGWFFRDRMSGRI